MTWLVALAVFKANYAALVYTTGRGKPLPGLLTTTIAQRIMALTATGLSKQNHALQLGLALPGPGLLPQLPKLADKVGALEQWINDWNTLLAGR